MKTIKVPPTWERDFFDSDATNFRAILFRLIRKADADNLRKLAKGFPSEVEVYRVWMSQREFPTEIKLEEAT